MAEFISFIAFWLLIMALIGGALLLVQRFRPKNDEDQKENETQDIADE